MRARHVAAAAIAFAVLVGCSGDGDSAATSSVVPPPSTDPSVTAEGTTPPASGSSSTAEATTTVATTRPETTTSSPASTTTPTDPPTTSTPQDDFATQAIAVIERTEESWEVVLTAFADPFNAEKVAALDGYFTGNQLEGFRNLIDDFRAGNFRSVRRSDPPEIYVAEPRSLALSLEVGAATVQVCHVDTSLIVETGGNPDGTDRVVADDVDQEIVELDLELVDGVWKVSSARAPETTVASCP